MPRRSRALLLGFLPLVPLLALGVAVRSDAGSPPWTTATVWATVHDPRIDEASGISRSTYARSLVFLHNDSGDTARFFAVGHDGATKAVFRVRDVRAVDWEDMAAGPDHTLWFGDIGDNAQQRTSISVVRVREPRELHSHAVNGMVFRLRYADGPHNAEAMLVRPHSGRVYVVTKDAAGGAIYRAPRQLSKHTTNVLRRVTTAPITVTGGDFAPGGHRLVLRSYARAFFYGRLGGHPHVVTLPAEQQGEAIAFTRDGRAVKVASEGVDQPIWRVAR